MSLTLQILSDLHLESPKGYDIFTITPKSPYLALLGDIGCVSDTSSYLTFLKSHLSQFTIVFLILGNHEPYHSNWETTRSRLQEFETEVNERNQNLTGTEERGGKFVLLDQTRYDLNPEVTILGCTLFSHIPASQEENVGFGLNDFYDISDWDVERHNRAHASDLEWLNDQITSISTSAEEGEAARRIIVLTHYSPTTSSEAVDPIHGKSKISSGFATDLSRETCWLSSNVKLWAFGHTHFNCDFVDVATGKRVVTNQRGYYFKQASGFDGDKCVKLLEQDL